MTVQELLEPLAGTDLAVAALLPCPRALRLLDHPSSSTPAAESLLGVLLATLSAPLVLAQRARPSLSDGTSSLSLRKDDR